MTLPVNRFNSLRDARAFLLSLSDESPSERVRQRALSLLKHYPSEDELRLLADRAPDLLSASLIAK